MKKINVDLSSQYKISVKFKILWPRLINSNDTSFSFVDENDSIKYKLEGFHFINDKENLRTLSKADILKLTCESFNSYDKAEEFSLLLYHRLLWYSFTTGTPITLLKVGSSENGYKQYFRITNGLSFDMYAQGGKGFADEKAKIIEKFFEIKDINLIDTDLEMILELYNLSQSNVKIEVRFLLLVICIETFIKKRDKSIFEKIINNILNSELLQDLVKDNKLNEKDEGILRSQLGNIKNESIKKSVENLIIQYLYDKKYYDMESIDFIKQVYDARSKFTHEGKLIFDNNCIDDNFKVVVELDKLVKDLIMIKMKTNR
jgi:hypothetical protein